MPFAIRNFDISERVQLSPETKLSILETLRGNATEMPRAVCAMIMSVAELTNLKVPTTKKYVLWWANINALRYEQEMDLLIKENPIA